MSNRLLMISYHIEMQIHPPVSHEFEEKDISSRGLNYMGMLA